ncbi:MAG TPA: hypothetical protein VG267_11670 [Terracidiphilus sp.]|jgi:hypothetical protein|nr:hypothetical protein [Terracidiphilus sp.]
MLRKIALALLLVSFGAITALAADVTGKWSGTVTTPRGDQQITFNFKVDGAALSGTVTTPRGGTDITDGKVDGANISFTQKVSFNGNDMTINYTGKVDGDSIKFTRTVGDRPAVEFTATRAKEGQ